MFAKSLVATVALASLASCQTSTSCNPLKKDCPADPAFGGKTVCDFSKGACSAFKELQGTKLAYKDDAAIFAIKEGTNAPTVQTGKYIFFGRVDVVMKAAPGAGIVTSFVLQSDDLDEIDWEFVGSDNVQAQTNYFSKGDDSTFTRGAYHPVDNPTGAYHTYTVEWTSKQVNWMINGKSVRTLDSATVGKDFPQSPMQIKLGSWCAGTEETRKGTREWAGGFTDFSKAPFNAYYKSVTIVDYAGKDSPANGGIKEYVYGDRSGSWESIKVVKGDGSSDSTPSDSASASASPSVSASDSKTSSQAKTNSGSSSSTTGSDSSKTTEIKVPMTTAAGLPTKSTTNATITGTKGSPTSSPSTMPTTGLSGAASRSAAVGGALLVGAGVALAQLFM
ncbi:cell wall glucanosyltransferase Mwg1 [Metarhizium rileyi]|uniref:Crh-like protein n=1 Tax=Metarhizium rileyi (strain RCEF 4871) TaxID=1649241 RepID=A0A167KFQ7_METRR|nr:cell wall glucanosyltransferase Mwg1 [Metarhizium rileyi RCEF 4871]TWU75092.1 hypothetical protein ED733_006897 [Metarhizium rileyi]